MKTPLRSLIALSAVFPLLSATSSFESKSEGVTIYGNVDRPILEKLGTVDIEACEGTPIVLPTGINDAGKVDTNVEELWRFESVHGLLNGEGYANWSNIDPEKRSPTTIVVSIIF